MEEILASIRRIIADDEAKPIAGEPAPAKPEPAAARPQAMTGIPPSAVKPARAPTPPAAPPPAAAPAAAASNSQDDIDAMLASLEADTSEAEVRPAQAEPEADVFELTEQMTVPAAELQTIEADDDLEFSEPPAIETAAYTRPYEPAPAVEPRSFSPPQTPAPAAMLSQSTAFAVESAFNSLANTVLSNNARTLEDLVKEMLRPMLKTWLDDNLPVVVERIVKAEIERVSRGR